MGNYEYMLSSSENIRTQAFAVPLYTDCRFLSLLHLNGIQVRLHKYNQEHCERAKAERRFLLKLCTSMVGHVKHGLHENTHCDRKGLP